MTVTAIGIRVVTALVDRCSITRSVGAVTSIVISLMRSIMLHSRKGVIGPTNRSFPTKCRGRSVWGLHHNLRDWRDACVGGGCR